MALGPTDALVNKNQVVLNYATKPLAYYCCIDHVALTASSLACIEYITGHSVFAFAPGYIQDLVIPYSPIRNHRSADLRLFVVPCSNLQSYGVRPGHVFYDPMEVLFLLIYYYADYLFIIYILNNVSKLLCIVIFLILI